MKMIKFLLLSLSFLTAGTINAQLSTYYGNKCYVEINAIGASPIISNRFQDNQFYSKTSSTSKSLSLSKDRLNYGFTGGITFLSKGKVSVGFTTALYYFNAPGPDQINLPGNNSGYSNDINVRFETLDLRSVTFMPILTIHGKNIIRPAGLNHEIGIGSITTKVQDHPYVINTSQQDYYDKNGGYHSTGGSQYVDSLSNAGYKFINTTTSNKRVCLMYGVKMRIPLSKNLLFNYGLRYTLNIGSRDSGGNNYNYDYSGFKDGIRIAQTYSFLTFGMGLTAIF